MPVFFLLVTDSTVPVPLVASSALIASASSQNFSVAWRASKDPSGCSNRANSSQKGSGTWARRSSSRSTISPSVGLWTRPTERKLEP